MLKRKNIEKDYQIKNMKIVNKSEIKMRNEALVKLKKVRDEAEKLEAENEASYSQVLALRAELDSIKLANHDVVKNLLETVKEGAERDSLSRNEHYNEVLKEKRRNTS